MIYRLFGIERDLFDNTASKEKSTYKLLFFLFWIVVTISAVSGGYLIYMIISSWYFAVPGALFIGFIIFSVLRFSLISTEKNMKHPDSKFKFFSSAFLFRLFLLMFFGAFIGFPLSSLMQRSGTGQIIDGKRRQMIEDYASSLEESRQHTLSYIISRINKKENHLNSINDSLEIINTKLQTDSLDESKSREVNFRKLILEKEKEKISEKLALVKQELQTEDSLFQIHVKKDIESFTNTVNSSELPLFQLSEISTSSAGIFIVSSSSLLFAILFLLLLWLTYSSKFTYAGKAIQMHRNLALSEYSITDIQNKKMIMSKFAVVHDPDVYFLDPPFNTKPVSQSKRIISGQTLEEYLEYKSKSSS